MKRYQVTGMSCAACSTHIENAVAKVEGVETVSVNLLMNSMNVEGTATDDEIIRAVQAAGYGAQSQLKDNADVSHGQQDSRTDYASDDTEPLQDTESQHIRKRLLYSILLLLPLMYISMGHHMWGWPLPAFLDGNMAAMGMAELLFTTLTITVNKDFFISGFKSVRNHAPNMDTLVALGAGAAYVYSICTLFTQTYEFYFESAAMILTLITVGKLLEAKAKGRTTNALKGLMKLAPKTAVLLSEDGREIVTAITEVHPGDLFVVRPGDSIPVDGIIVEGSAAVNEAALTGESIPVDKEAGDQVSAATINQTGYLKCRAERVGEDTTLSQTIRMVSDAAATKAPIAKVADKVSGVFVPIVISIAVLTILIWLIAGQTIGFALARGISVLVISCPCALGLATPVAIMVGNGVGAKQGILFKTAVSLELTGKVKTVALDKTGTITTGEPHVTDMLPEKNVTEIKLLTVAYALESKSEHPLAGAITRYANEHQIEYMETTDFQVVPGNGLTAVCEGKKLCAGNRKFILQHIQHMDSEPDVVARLAEEGKTPLYFAADGRLLGVIAVADEMKRDSRQAIIKLRDMGLKVVMLTGDNERTAKAIGKLAGVSKVYAGILPTEKESIIGKLGKEGSTAMVGDGINDAPALTRADVGIAIGAGTDVAIDAADVVLMKGSILDVAAAIRLSRAVLRNIHENLFWAFIYNIIGIPLAAGIWYPVFGWKLNPMFGAAAMSLSSFCVVMNALRLNFVDVYQSGTRKNQEQYQKGVDRQADTKQQNKQKEVENRMEKTIQIEGMMCEHCEGRVKKCLEAVVGVEQAVVSHEKGTAVVTLNGEVEDMILKNAVEAQDYQVTGIS